MEIKTYSKSKNLSIKTSLFLNGPFLAGWSVLKVIVPIFFIRKDKTQI